MMKHIRHARSKDAKISKNVSERLKSEKQNLLSL